MATTTTSGAGLEPSHQQTRPTLARPRLRLACYLAAIAVAAIPFLAEAWFLLRASRVALVGTMPDDGFYYLEIGRRAAAGSGFTFDGVNPTSGYHPLWQWILTALEWLTPGETAQIRVARLVGLLLTAVAFAVITKTVWRAAGPVPALTGLLLASRSVPALRLASDGMESSVALLAVAMTFAALDGYFRHPDRRHATVLGFCTALIVLARLDMVVAIPVLGVAVLFRAPRARNLAAWLGGGAILGLPYAVYHLLGHGGFLTTSAMVKDHWVSDHVGRLGGWFSDAHRQELVDVVATYIGKVADRFDGPLGVVSTLAALVFLALALYGVVKGIRELDGRRPRLGPTGLAATSIGVMLVLKFGVDVLRVPMWATDWYAIPAQAGLVFGLGVGAGFGARRLSERAPDVAFIPIVALAALALVPYGISDRYLGHPDLLTWQIELDRTADWLIANRPDGTIGAFDAGVLGYRLHGVGPVVNLDGLVNDREYATFLAERPDKVTRLRREHIDVLVNALGDEERRTDLSCATTLWQSGRDVGMADGPDQIYVLDVRACR